MDRPQQGWRCAPVATVGDLPTIALQNVFMYLPLIERCRAVPLVCRRWAEVCAGPSPLWASLDGLDGCLTSGPQRGDALMQWLQPRAPAVRSITTRRRHVVAMPPWLLHMTARTLREVESVYVHGGNLQALRDCRQLRVANMSTEWHALEQLLRRPPPPGPSLWPHLVKLTVTCRRRGEEDGAALPAQLLRLPSLTCLRVRCAFPFEAVLWPDLEQGSERGEGTQVGEAAAAAAASSAAEDAVPHAVSPLERLWLIQCVPESSTQYGGGVGGAGGSIGAMHHLRDLLVANQAIALRLPRQVLHAAVASLTCLTLYNVDCSSCPGLWSPVMQLRCLRVLCIAFCRLSPSDAGISEEGGAAAGAGAAATGGGRGSTAAAVPPPLLPAQQCLSEVYVRYCGLHAVHAALAGCVAVRCLALWEPALCTLRGGPYLGPRLRFLDLDHCGFAGGVSEALGRHAGGLDGLVGLKMCSQQQAVLALENVPPRGPGRLHSQLRDAQLLATGLPSLELLAMCSSSGSGSSDPRHCSAEAFASGSLSYTGGSGGCGGSLAGGHCSMCDSGGTGGAAAAAAARPLADEVLLWRLRERARRQSGGGVGCLPPWRWLHASWLGSEARCWLEEEEEQAEREEGGREEEEGKREGEDDREWRAADAGEALAVVRGTASEEEGPSRAPAPQQQQRRRRHMQRSQQQGWGEACGHAQLCSTTTATASGRDEGGEQLPSGLAVLFAEAARTAGAPPLFCCWERTPLGLAPPRGSKGGSWFLEGKEPSMAMVRPW